MVSMNVASLAQTQNVQLTAQKQQQNNMPKVSFGHKEDTAEFSTKQPTEAQKMSSLDKATRALMLALALVSGTGNAGEISIPKHYQVYATNAFQARAQGKQQLNADGCLKKSTVDKVVLNGDATAEVDATCYKNN